MRLSVVTTTITPPQVLRLLSKYALPGTKFYVVGDTNGDHHEIEELVDNIPTAVYLHPDAQKHWRCSAPIGWRCVQRRNIGFLEALQDGAEAIITIDDDNFPLARGYFAEFDRLLSDDFIGFQVGKLGWVDSGKFLYPTDGKPAVQRGTPQTVYPNHAVSFVTDVKIGLVQGAILGNPDTSAIDRLSRNPEIHQVSELLRTGFVLNPTAVAAVNTQNTAFLSHFVPTMFVAPRIGRYDDIVGGILTQRAMRETGHHVHFGQPFAWQERHAHDLITDLELEMWGNRHMEEVVDFLARMPFCGGPISFAYHFYAGCACLPQQTKEAALAYLEDIQRIGK